MRQLLFGVVVFLLACNSIAQVRFNGKIQDSENQLGIAHATIVFDGGAVISNMKGEFSIEQPTYPMVLYLSHVSYHPQTLIINTKYESGIVISLIPKTVAIERIEVVGEKIKRFFKGQNYYILDYVLMDNNILTIGYEQKNMNRGKMVLSGINDDKNISIEIEKPKKLYKDGFGNIHVFAGDSVFQVYVHNSDIWLLYPTSVDDFSKELLKYKFPFSNYHIFREFLGEGQVNNYYAIDTVSRETLPIKTVYSEELFSVSQAAERYRQWKPNWSKKVAADPGGANAMFEVYVLDIFVTHKPIHSQIFKMGGELFLFDIANNRTYLFNANLKEFDIIPNHFPKHHKRNKQIIQDSKTEKFYWVYYKGNKALLGEIDPYSGKIVDEIETPSLPFIENISIHDGELWFLYQPRLGETSRSLFHKKF